MVQMNADSTTLPSGPDKSRDGSERARIAVIIPCYKVRDTILDVLDGIGPDVNLVICVDDGCPEESGRLVEERHADDPRVIVARHNRNLGVGAAICTGYRTALALGAEVLVKIDGDGQMDPRLISYFCGPVLSGEADYVKGNRFFDIDTVRQMPAKRLVGNAALSFLCKASSGYWDLFDPTNGYSAIASGVAAELPLEKLHQRYFFESDMLFRLGTLRARVVELPMVAKYGLEISNLNELHALATFPLLHLRNALKRIVYSYFLRGFSVASVNLALGLVLTIFGLIFGLERWGEVRAEGMTATPGTVMLAALPVLVGIQLLLAFLSHDMAMVPRTAVQRQLHRIRVLSKSPAARPRS